MIIAVGNDGLFASFCRTAGHPEWARDARFLTNPLRVKNRNQLMVLIGSVTETRSTGEWIAAMESAGVPCGPINNLDKGFSDSPVPARGMRIEMPLPSGGTVPQVAKPIRMLASPVQYRNAPPMLGEHTEQVLIDWLAMSLTEIRELQRKRLIFGCGSGSNHPN